MAQTEWSKSRHQDLRFKKDVDYRRAGAEFSYFDINYRIYIEKEGVAASGESVVIECDKMPILILRIEDAVALHRHLKNLLDRTVEFPY